MAQFSWTTAADWDAEVDNTGMVHDADGDHAGAGTVQPGYVYGGPASDLTDTGLVGWWPLHEQSGSAVDLSGSGNTGTVNGAMQSVAGRGGLSAYSFDGTDDRVSVANDTSLQVASDAIYSLSAWVKTGNSGANQGISGKYTGGDGYYHGFYDADSDGQCEYFTYRRYGGSNAVGVYTESLIPDGNWHHVTAVSNGEGASNFQLFVNGSEASTTVWLDNTGNTGTFTVPLAIGDRHDDGSSIYWPFDGQIADARVYNRALSAAEIQTLYEWGAADLATPATDGIAYYPMDGSAADAWGTNDGTVNGATLQTGGGIRGDCYSFDGVDDYITLPDFTLSTGYTLSAWFHADDVTANGAIYYTKADAELIIRVQSGQLRFYHRDGGGTYQLITQPSISIGEWYHAAMAWDGSAVDCYLNSANVGSQAVSGATAVAAPNRIGNNASGETEHFDGLIDDARIYGYALTPDEVHDLYRWGTFGRDMRHFTAQAVA